MAISKQKKVDIIKKVSERTADAESIVFVNFHGLSVAQATELRKSLRALGAGYTVAKKTLLRRALADRFTGEMPELEGEVAIAYGTDPIGPARGIYEFEKKNKEVVKIIGGVYEGAYVPAPMMIELASIPSREVLLGKLVNLLNSPIQRVVMAVNEIAKAKA